METPRKLPSPRCGHKSPAAMVVRLDDSPVMSKRRRTDEISPLNLTEEGSSLSITPLSTPSDSPVPVSWIGAEGDQTADGENDERKQYKKRHDLWRAIANNYQYLMDEELIEACKSTESDEFSYESDDIDTNSKVSFTEFVQQYKELFDWLTNLQSSSEKQTSVLSEKYLNQNYHEELRRCMPRRRMLSDYARQLMRRYPNMKEDISLRLQRLHTYWETLEKTLSPQSFLDNNTKIVQDIDEDIDVLQQWLKSVESRLLCSWLVTSWTADDIRGKLRELQILYGDIQARSKAIGAVQQLCEIVNTTSRIGQVSDVCDRQLTDVITLRQRYHKCWLSSVEWQCRLEEALEDRLSGKIKARCSRRGLKLDECDDDIPASPLPLIAVESPAAEGNSSNELPEDCAGSVESDCSDIIPFCDSDYEKFERKPVSPSCDDQSNSVAGESKVFNDCCKNLTQSEGRDIVHHRRETNRSNELESSSSSGAFSGSLTESSASSHSTADSSPAESNKVVSKRGDESCDKMSRLCKGAELVGAMRELSNLDGNDVGYSTESLSNEDGLMENGGKEKCYGFKTSSLKEVTDYLDKHQDDGLTSHHHKQAWRQSAASCYDTGSNGSLFISACDLGIETSPNTTINSVINKSCEQTPTSKLANEKCAVNGKVTYQPALIPHRHYYCMTNVDRELQEDADLLDSVDLEPEPYPGLSANSESDFSASVPVAAISANGDASISGALDDVYDNDTSFGASSLSESDEECGELESSGAGAAVSEMRTTSFGQKYQLNDSNLKSTNSSFLSPIGFSKTTTSAVGQSTIMNEQSRLYSMGGVSSETDEFVTALSEWDESMYSPFGSPIRESYFSKAMRNDNTSSVLSNGSILRSRKRLDYLASSESALYDTNVRGASLQQSFLYSQTLPALNACTDNNANRTNNSLIERERRKRPMDNGMLIHSPGNGHVLHSTPCGKENWKSVGKYEKKKSGDKKASRKLALRDMNISQSADDKVTDSDAEVIEIMRHADVSIPVDHIYMGDSQSEAWDNYQDPMYPSVSDDPAEEKLDASHLQADWEAVLDETTRKQKHVNQKRGKQRRRSNIAERDGMKMKGMDSDSDQEDFNDVVERSEEAIQFLESFLMKKHKKKQISSSNLDPSEYTEAVETCEYYIRCLHDVYETLLSEMEISGVKPSGLQKISACISKLKDLCQVAKQRRDQMIKLSTLIKEQNQIKLTMPSMISCLEMIAFDYEHLNNVLSVLKSKQEVASKVHSRLTEVKLELLQFAEENADFSVQTVLTDVSAIMENVICFQDRCLLRETAVASALAKWMLFDKIEIDLEQRLKQEEQQLRCLNIAIDTVKFSRNDCIEAVQDMQTIVGDVPSYNEKLDTCRQCLNDMAAVLDNGVLQKLAEKLAHLSHRVASLVEQAELMGEKMKEKTMRTVGVQADDTFLTSCELPSTSSLSNTDEMPYLWSVLRGILPVGLATIVLVSLMSAFGVSWYETLESLGLTFHLDLRHINGPRSA